MPLNPAELTSFLSDLSADNNKTWFEEHRDLYQKLRIQFTDLVQDVIVLLAEVDRTMQHTKPEQGLFRINRDIRFSKDKSPYKTQFSALLSPMGRKTESPGYYLQWNHLGELMVAGGLYMTTPEQLASIRGYIVNQPQKLSALLATKDLIQSFPNGLEGEQLKRPPKGIDETAPHMDHLKRKGFTVGTSIRLTRTATVGKDVLPVISKGFISMVPLIEWLREAIGN